MIDLAAERKDYKMASLDEHDITTEPITFFEHWLEEAVTAKVPEPTAMNLATIDDGGYPSGRIVLLKGIDTGFIFYSHYTSDKGLQIARIPKVSLTFHWVELERQVRIVGIVEKVDEATSDAYFNVRPYASQIGAVASPQSQVVKSRAELEARYVEAKNRHPKHVERPADWGGYRVVPHRIEFWQGRRSRMHDRILFTKKGIEWTKSRLAP